jgi:NAD(P)H-dependent flavin oxidoreductase YrpB (nitropropane dioxygenase family)
LLKLEDTPVVQAGMGGVSGHELAAAVSEAGGLGTIAGAGIDIAAEIAAARALTSRTVAVNLLLPFARRADLRAAAAADVLVTFWGEPRRATAGTWFHQCGSVSEAKAAASAGVDAVILQGVEAGGHVRGTKPLLELLERTCAAIKVPVLAAGGIVDAAGVREVLGAGATAAVVGTRFLLSEESRAHPLYKQRCVEGGETLLTELFGLGWPGAPHRVIPNEATLRWLRKDPRGPAWIRAANRLSAPLARRIPVSLQERATRVQRASQPFLGPRPPSADDPDSLVDSAPLYAGVGVGAIRDVRPAGELVAELTP